MIYGFLGHIPFICGVFGGKVVIFLVRSYFIVFFEFSKACSSLICFFD